MFTHSLHSVYSVFTLWRRQLAAVHALCHVIGKSWGGQEDIHPSSPRPVYHVTLWNLAWSLTSCGISFRGGSKIHYKRRHTLIRWPIFLPNFLKLWSNLGPCGWGWVLGMPRLDPLLSQGLWAPGISSCRFWLVHNHPVVSVCRHLWPENIAPEVVKIVCLVTAWHESLVDPGFPIGGRQLQGRSTYYLGTTPWIWK